MMKFNEYENAVESYESNKKYLKLSQRRIYKKYIDSVKKYSDACKENPSTTNYIFDDLIIRVKTHNVGMLLRTSFDDVYVLSIDKNKLEQAKKTISKDIEWINELTEKIIESKGNYLPNYSNDEILEFFGYNQDISHLIELQKSIRGEITSKDYMKKQNESKQKTYSKKVIPFPKQYMEQ